MNCIGDAAMANFGTQMYEMTVDTFDCAVAMNEALEKWNQNALKTEFEIEHRMELFGGCVVGNMGSKHRIEFAVLGDTVNVASKFVVRVKNSIRTFNSSELREY